MWESSLQSVLYGSPVIRCHDGDGKVSCMTAVGFALDLLSIQVPCDYSDKLSGDSDLNISIESRASRLLLIFGFVAACDGLAHYCLCSTISG